MSSGIRFEFSVFYPLCFCFLGNFEWSCIASVIFYLLKVFNEVIPWKAMLLLLGRFNFFCLLNSEPYTVLVHHMWVTLQSDTEFTWYMVQMLALKLYPIFPDPNILLINSHFQIPNIFVCIIADHMFGDIENEIEWMNEIIWFTVWELWTYPMISLNVTIHFKML